MLPSSLQTWSFSVIVKIVHQLGFWGGGQDERTATNYLMCISYKECLMCGQSLADCILRARGRCRQEQTVLTKTGARSSSYLNLLKMFFWNHFCNLFVFLRVLVQRPIMQSAPEEPSCVHNVAAVFDVFVNLGLFQCFNVSVKWWWIFYCSLKSNNYIRVWA